MMSAFFCVRALVVVIVLLVLAFFVVAIIVLILSVLMPSRLFLVPALVAVGARVFVMGSSQQL